MVEILLTGPKGDNPLGFLTALGTLRVLAGRGHQVGLHWTAERQPALTMSDSWTDQHLVDELHRTLARKPGEGQEETAAALAAWDAAKKTVARKRSDLKKRRLRGKEGKEVRAAELAPLVGASDQQRQTYLLCLNRSAPDPTVTLGKNLTATCEEFTLYCRQSVDQAKPGDRRWADLCAAFGSANPDQPDARMNATPLALVSGSGHQDFLGSIQALMVELRPEHVRRALFGPWEPTDEKHSLRLDAMEDRRYAIMDRDPTASGNKPRTLWGANRLAFEAFAFYPCMPAGRSVAISGWRMTSKDEGTWRWPLWDCSLSADAVRVILTHPDIWRDEPEARRRLRAMGCFTLLGSQRIRVGTGQNVKFNLTPGIPLW